MYRCNVCRNVSRPRQTRRLHIIYRDAIAGYRYDPEVGMEKIPRQEIAKELPVCNACAQALEEGVTLEQLRVVHARPLVPLPPPPPVVNKPLSIGKPVEPTALKIGQLIVKK